MLSMKHDKKPWQSRSSNDPGKELIALEAVGFSRTEALVYTKLLELGATTAGPLVRRAGLHRQLVYSALESLEEQGIVSHALRNGRKVFSAARPDTVLQRENERMRELELVMPFLQSLATGSPDPLHVDILRGRDQFIRRLMLIVDSAARSDGIIRAFAPVRDTDVYSFVGADYERYIDYCKKMKVRKHFIIPASASSSEYPKRLLKERGTTVRFFESGLSLPTATIMTPEVISIDLFGREVVSIMIWNKTIAKSFLDHFRVMWKTARARQ
jgi:sugar-specific transcriptional regulator TrmB